jgi:hypothetical protein
MEKDVGLEELGGLALEEGRCAIVRRMAKDVGLEELGGLALEEREMCYS